jgi:hypothetical protein
MAANILGSFNKIINETATAIIDSNIASKISDVLNTLVNSTFEAVEDTLKKVQDLTKTEGSAESTEPAEPAEPEGP